MIFSTKNPNLFFFGGGGGGRWERGEGKRARVINFLYKISKSKKEKKIFFFGRWGGGWAGLE